MVSDSVKKWYHEKYNIEKIWVIRNIPKTSPRFEIKNNIFRKKFSISSKKIIFLYQGVIAEGRGINTLLRIFQEKEKNHHIVFMGFGDMANEVLESSKNNHNIHFHEAVDPDQISKYSNSADVGLSLINNTCLNYYLCLPNKFWEYLNSEIPVLVCNYPEMKKIVNEYNCGWTIPLDINQISNLIEKLTPEEIEIKKNNVIKMKGKFGWEFEEKTLLKMYKNLGFNKMIKHDKIVIIDSGYGNTKAVRNMLLSLGLQSRISKKAKDLDEATQLILPGVGSFDAAMKSISPIVNKICEIVVDRNIPILGICLGMQLLGTSSEEGNEKA